MRQMWMMVVMAACVQAVPCQPGQERFGDSCYQLLTEQMTWEEAATTCSDMGAGLAVPDSPDEHQFIWEMFTGSVFKRNLWIGCNDKQEEGKYVQPGEDGRACDYLNWAPGEPSGTIDEDCLYMWRIRSGLWNDAHCYHRVFAICESPAIPSMSCLREDHADGRFTAHCLTSHSIKDFPTKSAIAWALTCRDEPRCRSFNLRQGSNGQKICQLNGAEADMAVVNFCQYFYF